MINSILLAEDDDDDADMFREALHDLNPLLELVRGKNGKESLAKLRTGSQTPEIIFLDVNMPEMNGWGCLSVLKADNKWSAIPVLLYSTSSPLLYGQQALDAGAIGFYEKPTSFQNFKAFLGAIVEPHPANLHQTLKELQASGKYSLLVR